MYVKHFYLGGYLKMKKRNHLMLLILTVTALSFVGCGTQANNTENNVDNAESVQTSEDDTVNVADTSEDGSNVVESVETDEVVASEESMEESIPEEPAVEMMDFETWAKQEGNEEVCLVVWNEELGVQEILPTFKENEEIYLINDGDKFAIPFNEVVTAIHINDESLSYPVTADYLEVALIKGQMNEVSIFFKNEQGETKTKGYMLK